MSIDLRARLCRGTKIWQVKIDPCIGCLSQFFLIDAGIPPGDILVLTQRGVIGIPIFEKLTAEGIPVKSYYAEKELDAEAAQYQFALLKLYVNRNDRVALRWLLGLGSSNWRAASYKRIRALLCEEKDTTPWHAGSPTRVCDRTRSSWQCGRSSVGDAGKSLTHQQHITDAVNIMSTFSNFIGNILTNFR